MFAVNSRKQVVVCVLSIFMITFSAFTPSTVFVQAKQVPSSATRSETQHVELGESIPSMEQASDTSVGAVKNQQTTTAESASPIIFIENVGQFDPRADFQAQANGATTYFSEDAIWYTLLEPPSKDPNDDRHNTALDRLVEENQKPRKGVNLKVSLVGSNPHPTIEPFNKVATSFSYFTGSDLSNWQTDVPVWGGIRYVDIYPGMNLEITSEQNHLLWQFMVTDASRFDDKNNQAVQQGIRIKIAGHQRLQTRNDTLNIATDVGTLSLPIIRVDDAEILPEVDQNGDLLVPISAQTTSLGTFRTVSYTIPTSTESKLSLLGQPTSIAQTINRENIYQQSSGSSLIYSAYFGTKYTLGDAIAVDNDGYVYVAGSVGWDDFPLGTGVFYLPGASSTSHDSFVAKIDLDTNQLIYTAFFKTKPAYPGCDNTGFVGGIAVDNNKSVYVVGTTGNPDFPTTAGVIDGQLTDQCPGNPHYFYEERADGFILKLNAAGNQLLYSTYLGGSDYDRVDGVFVGEDGSAYVAGSTYSTDIPRGTQGYNHTLNGLSDLFITKLSPAADQQEFFTYVGGNDLEFTWGNLKVGNDGLIYLGGTTKSSDFPATADAYITSYSNSSSCNSSCYNAFALKLDSTGNTLMYATYLGEVGSGYATDLDVDEMGHAYISGFIRGGANFPHTRLLGPISAPSTGMDGFVVKLATDGKSAVYSDLIGGTGSDTLWAISVSNTGNAFLVGDSSSANFPITSDALDSSVEEFGADLIIAELDPNGSQLTYATYLGGSGWDYMSYRGAPLDSNGNINILVRNTESTDFPTNHPPIGNGTNGSNEFGWWTAAVVRFSTNSPAYDCSGTVVSPIAQAVLDVVGNEQKYCGNHYDNQTDDKLITLPPGQDAFQKFGTLAETARHEVDFVTMGWDPYDDELGNSPGTIFLQGIKNLYTAVLANPEDYPDGVRVRILLGLKYYEATDCQDQRVIVMNDLDRLGIFPNSYFNVEVAAYRDAKQDKCRARDQLLGSTHSHVKMMIVDGKDVITGGYNMHYNYLGVDPNIPVVHDMGVQISGPIAQDALDVFYGLWINAYRCDQHATNVCTQESIIQTINLNPAVLTTTVTGDEVVFSLFRDHTNKTADNAIEAAISAAGSEVNLVQNRFIDTIYGDTPQYVTGILNAIDKDGVFVNLLVSGGNGRAEGMLDLAANMNGVCNLYDQIQEQDPLDLPRFKFRYSRFANPTHTKALSIDDAFIIVGSQNFDPSAWGDNSFSFGDLAEYSLGVDSDQAASDFQTKFTNEWNAAADLPCLSLTDRILGPTLQDSIDQAAPGTAIFIPAGVFTGSVIIDKPLVLVGTGTNETIIQPDGNEPAFQIKSSDVAIANLKISGGGGYGIELIDSSSSSLNNILITRVVFEDNVQGGVLAQGLIPGSPMDYSIENNTFIGGADGIVIDMLETQVESSIVRNNIFSGQSNTPVHIISAHDSHVEYSYNLFDDCGLGDCATNWVQGSISALSNVHDNLFDLDPLFASPENGAYQLSVDSPAIDAGDPDLYHDFFFDGDDDGLVRIDMGAFEHAPVANVAPVVNAGNDQTITLGDDVVVNATYSDADNTENHSARIDWGDEIIEDVPVDMTGPGTGDVAGQHTYASAGTYTVEVCVTDIYGAVGCDTATIVVNNAFPHTSILDDFNRANGSIGSNWYGNTAGYNISANQLLVKSKNANLDIYWNTASFGPDQEAYFTFSSVSTTSVDQDLILKSQYVYGWAYGLIDVQYEARENRVVVWTYDHNQSWVQYGADIPVTFVNGDQFGARALSNGTLEVYRNGVLIATRDISAWPYNASGGYIGLWFGNAKDALIDDFGGGNIPQP